MEREMQYTPFNLVEERERSSLEYREQRARLRELTIKPEPVELTPREEMAAKMERVRAVVSGLEPGSPGAVSGVCNCLRDVAAVLSYCLDALPPAD